jgi:hypothetical protein
MISELFDGLQAPVVLHTTGSNSGNWKFHLKAVFDSRPTEMDIFAASKALGYGPSPFLFPNLPEKLFGAYILSKAEIKQIDSQEEDHGLWSATWSAILD